MSGYLTAVSLTTEVAKTSAFSILIVYQTDSTVFKEVKQVGFIPFSVQDLKIIIASSRTGSLSVLSQRRQFGLMQKALRPFQSNFTSELTGQE